MHTSREVAEMLGLSKIRVTKAAAELATKVGGVYIWDDESIEKLKARKGKRGNPNWTKKSEL